MPKNDPGVSRSVTTIASAGCARRASSGEKGWASWTCTLPPSPRRTSRTSGERPRKRAAHGGADAPSASDSSPLARRASDATTTSGVSGVPLWNWTSGRRRNVQVRPSRDTRHCAASPGSRSPRSPISTSPWKSWRLTSRAAGAVAVTGSRTSGSRLTAIRSSPLGSPTASADAASRAGTTTRRATSAPRTVACTAAAVPFMRPIIRGAPCAGRAAGTPARASRVSGAGGRGVRAGAHELPAGRRGRGASANAGRASARRRLAPPLQTPVVGARGGAFATSKTPRMNPIILTLLDATAYTCST